jgi:hypothetical protein
MSEEEADDLHEKAQAFHAEFKVLVRKYVPTFPQDNTSAEFLSMIQDRTSCFAPYIWSDDTEKVHGNT